MMEMTGNVYQVKWVCLFDMAFTAPAAIIY